MSQTAKLMNAKILVPVIIGAFAIAAAAVVLTGEGEKASAGIENFRVSDVTATGAILEVDYDLGFGDSASIRFGYRENSSESWQYTDWWEEAGSGNLNKPISNLNSASLYEFKVDLKRDSKITSSSSKTFETSFVPPSAGILGTTNTGQTSAVLTASYNSGSYENFDIRFSYKGIDEERESTKWTMRSGSGEISENIENLVPGMVYVVNAELKYDNEIRQENKRAFNTLSLPGEPSVPHYEAVGKVTMVSDGDTMHVNLSWIDNSKPGVQAHETLRFGGGIDAPEDPEEEGGPEATEFMKNLCGSGTEVILDVDDKSTRGMYGRLITVIYVWENNSWVNVNAAEYKWGKEAFPSNDWDEYIGFDSEFNMYDWEKDNYPYVQDC